MVTGTACGSCRAQWGLSQKLGPVPEAGSTEGLRQEGMSCVHPSQTFQYLVETPKEYPPHCGRSKVTSCKVVLGSRLKQVSDFLPAGGWDKNHMRLPQKGGEDLPEHHLTHCCPPTDRLAEPQGWAEVLACHLPQCKGLSGRSQGAGAGGRQTVPGGRWPGGGLGREQRRAPQA